MKNKVREARVQKGWSQSDLAAQTSVSRQSIYAVEAGKYVPTTILALKLAQALEQPVEALFLLEADD
ncbi:MAG: transcriptional regulator [Sphingobacteriales bacterium]|nr:MAG: transcriptional regulator [Sphingobacteriales bacterium]